MWNRRCNTQSEKVKTKARMVEVRSGRLCYIYYDGFINP